MSQTKKLKPCSTQETTQWIRFLDTCFAYQAPQSYGIDFAPLFSEDALTHSRLLWQEDEILASATLYPRTLITPDGLFRIGIIGAVATRADCRGRGYSSELLRELETVARSLSLEGLILWSDQQEFYARLGFEAQGQQQLLSLSTIPKPLIKTKGGLVKGWTLPEVARLYNEHPLRLERSEEYWGELHKITSCQRFQWELNNKVKAYVALGKGCDLQDIIHEWGGEAIYLYHLVWALLQTRQNLQWLTHPNLKDPIRERAVRGGDAAINSGHLALFKPLSPQHDWKAVFQKAWFWGLDSL